MHVVLSARTVPPLPLGRLRAIEEARRHLTFQGILAASAGDQAAMDDFVREGIGTLENVVRDGFSHTFGTLDTNRQLVAWLEGLGHRTGLRPGGGPGAGTAAGTGPVDGRVAGRVAGPVAEPAPSGSGPDAPGGDG